MKIPEIFFNKKMYRFRVILELEPGAAEQPDARKTSQIYFFDLNAWIYPTLIMFKKRAFA